MQTCVDICLAKLIVLRTVLLKAKIQSLMHEKEASDSIHKRLQSFVKVKP